MELTLCDPFPQIRALNIQSSSKTIKTQAIYAANNYTIGHNRFSRKINGRAKKKRKLSFGGSLLFSSSLCRV